MINCPSIFEYQYYYYFDEKHTHEVVILYFTIFSTLLPTTHWFSATHFNSIRKLN